MKLESYKIFQSIIRFIEKVRKLGQINTTKNESILPEHKLSMQLKLKTSPIN